MKRIFLKLICMIMLVCLALTGCATSDGNTEETSETTPETTTSETTTAADKKITLKVGSYNLAYAGRDKDISAGEDLKEVNLKAIAAEIVKYELDIVGLQEIEEKCSRSGNKDFMKLLSEYTGYQYYAFGKSMDFGGGAIGTGMLSKYPLNDFEVIKMSEGSEDGYGEPRTVSKATITVDGVDFLFLNTHLSAKGEETAVRAKQLTKITEVIGDAERWILTGDFNITNFDEYKSLNTKYISIQHKYSYNTKADGTAQSIDNILFSKSISYHRSGISDVKPNNSDHVLLLAQLKYTVPAA